ncbi:YafY family protein [Bacillus sp. JCM 19041]|uniref:helix-turn-helix transcriptional regulator n=1 Tax=Bacillus sp. JCM 19041 TaxID=1460637 RepID=UPI0006CF2A5D
MRAERFIAIISLLQNRGRITTEALAEELHVSPRTILRDMDALSVAGIPIYSVRGKHGGWSLLDGFKTNLTSLKPGDLTSLLAFPSEKVLNDLGMNKGMIDVREKLLSSMPIDHRVETKTIWERIYIDTGTWRNASEETTYLEIVQKAVLENRKLEIVYKKVDGREDVREVEPLGLVAKTNKWYLIALRDNQFRTYRVSRITAVTILDDVFKRPTQFNLIHYWEKSKSEFISRLPEYFVILEMNTTILNRITFTSKFIHSLNVKQHHKEDWAYVELTFHDKQEALEFCLGFGNQLRVISPTDLKKEVVRSAQEVIALYQGVDEVKE